MGYHRPPMREAMSHMTREERAKINRAEIQVLQSTWSAYKPPDQSLALTRFPFQDYEYEKNRLENLHIEVERIIWPFLHRSQAVIFWREIERPEIGYRTVILDRNVITSMMGRLYGWGWPLRGWIFSSLLGAEWTSWEKPEP